jgi:O-antigen/teichoic acid export membrane protein
MDQFPQPASSGGLPSARRIKGQMARGIAWMTAARLGVRSLGLVSTMILARLLVPEDFGLIALAMSVVALLDTINQFGFETPLIQKRDATRDDFDSAWTLNILLAVIVATGIVLMAPLAAGFFKEPRVEEILYWIAAGNCFLAFQNIGVVKFRKQLNFRRDFALQVTQKAAMLAVTIPLAFWLRSYWAMVAGMVAGNIAAVAVSYLFLPYRPRFCLKSARMLFGFSKWIQVTSMLRYVRDRGYVLIMGRLLDASAMGLFSVAKEVGSTVPNTLIAPLNRAVMPGYARMAHDPELLRDGYRSMLGLVALVTVPASVGIAALAALIVPVALGPKWQAAVPLLGILSLAGISRSLTASTISVHYATGQPRQQTLITGIQAFTLLPAVLAGVYFYGLPGAAWAYLLHSLLLFLPVCYWVLFRTTPIRFDDTWRPLWRPLLAAVLMYVVLKPLSDAWAVPGTWAALPRLLALVALGAVLYAGAVAVLWWLSGRPAGAEQVLLRKLRERLHRRGGAAP